MRRILYCMAGVVLGLTAATQIHAKDTIRIGYPSFSMKGISPKDAMVAIEVWSSQMSLREGHPIKPQISLLQTPESMVQEINAGNIDMIALSALDYIRIRNKTALEPSLVMKFANQIDDRFLLLARKGSGLSELSHLKNKKLIGTSEDVYQISLIWLDTILAKSGLNRAKTFFSLFQKTDKTSKAVLQVFFGQADVCIVREQFFLTLSELNPQLSKELIVIEESPPFLIGLTCFTQACEKEKKQIIRSNAFVLHKYTEGQQILNLFGNASIIPFEPSYLKTVEDLVQEYKHLYSENP